MPPDNNNTEQGADPGEHLESDLSESIQASRNLKGELCYLFGEEIVEQANQIDIADLNLNDDMIACISRGVRQLKELKHKPIAQKDLVMEMEPGARIVLCLWIMDMDLLGKIQARSYLA